jgi:H+/Cl- antiporter ClcA
MGPADDAASEIIRPAGRRLRRTRLAPRLWLRQAQFWVGAIVVALIIVAFSQASDAAQVVFQAILARWGAYAPFLLSPLGLLLSVWLTRRFFPGAQGSGIPQVIAALRINDPRAISAMLSARIAVGKVLLTLLGLAAGASIGREGPCVQVGASIMDTLSQLDRRPRPHLRRALVLAGGAAGVAAAFNTPLAGIVFAIEELSRSFEARASGTTLTAVILGGITTLALVGNYTYFGVTSVALAFGPAWLAVLVCSLAGGLAGGVFSAILVRASRGLPGLAGRLVIDHPFAFAALCGFLLAGIGWLSDGTTFGTGYTQARHLVEGSAHVPWAFPFLKLAATVVSYLSGIPGGIFAPSLAVGAGIGKLLAPLVPGAPAAAMVLLGMVGYFAGVVQAPITAAVIVMEMTDNQTMTVPLLATAMLAFAVSRSVCRRPLYGALAERFLTALARRPT